MLSPSFLLYCCYLLSSPPQFRSRSNAGHPGITFCSLLYSIKPAFFSCLGTRTAANRQLSCVCYKPCLYTPCLYSRFNLFIFTLISYLILSSCAIGFASFVLDVSIIPTFRMFINVEIGPVKFYFLLKEAFCRTQPPTVISRLVRRIVSLFLGTGPNLW